MRFSTETIAEIEGLRRELESYPEYLVKETGKDYSPGFLDKVKNILSDIDKAVAMTNTSTALRSQTSEQQETDAAHEHA